MEDEIGGADNPHEHAIGHAGFHHRFRAIRHLGPDCDHTRHTLTILSGQPCLTSPNTHLTVPGHAAPDQIQPGLTAPNLTKPVLAEPCRNHAQTDRSMPCPASPDLIPPPPTRPDRASADLAWPHQTQPQTISRLT